MALRIKHILIGTGIFAGLILLLAAAAVFYLKTDHAQRLVQAKVGASIPGAISWKRLRFSLLKGEFELENFLLKGPVLTAFLSISLVPHYSEGISRSQHSLWKNPGQRFR